MIDAKIFLEGLESLENDRGVSREVVLNALKEAMEKAFRKQLGNADDALVRCDIDDKASTIKLFQLKNVVEEVEDDFLEISLEDAKKENKDAKVGDQYEIPYSIDFLTKGSVQLIASVLRQKIAEAEKSVLYEQYKDFIGELIQGTVEKCDERGAIINVGRLSVFLPRVAMIAGEKFKVGDVVKLYVADVVSTPKGAQVIVSRTDANFLKRLFENEVHEIYEGTVIIKNIAREAGKRSKVAVYSLDSNVPATGACIGPNGSRIQKIVGQLGNGSEKEKIDVINYYENPGLYIMEALKPSNVRGVVLDEANKKAIAVVPNNELSVAIGKQGVNARLAVKLTGWNIDIKELDDALSQGIVYKTQEDLIRDDELKANEELEHIDDSNVTENDVTEVVTPVEEKVEETVEEVKEDVTKDEEVIKTEPTKVEEKVEAKPAKVEEKVEIQNVKTNKTLADLEQELENEKKRQLNANNRQRKWKKNDNSKKEEEKEKDVSLIPDGVKPEHMDIYTPEELKAFEEEENEEEEEDEDIDYDEFDSYYDE